MFTNVRTLIILIAFINTLTYRERRERRRARSKESCCMSSSCFVVFRRVIFVSSATAKLPPAANLGIPWRQLTGGREHRVHEPLQTASWSSCTVFFLSFFLLFPSSFNSETFYYFIILFTHPIYLKRISVHFIPDRESVIRNCPKSLSQPKKCQTPFCISCNRLLLLLLLLLLLSWGFSIQNSVEQYLYSLIIVKQT